MLVSGNANLQKEQSTKIEAPQSKYTQVPSSAETRNKLTVCFTSSADTSSCAGWFPHQRAQTQLRPSASGSVLVPNRDGCRVPQPDLVRWTLRYLLRHSLRCATRCL